MPNSDGSEMVVLSIVGLRTWLFPVSPKDVAAKAEHAQMSSRHSLEAGCQ